MHKISLQDLEDPDHVMITHSAAQYFTTLFHNYRVQVGFGDAVQKREKTKDRSRGMSRKQGKLMRRNKAIPAFETSHEVTGLSLLMDKDYMSSEESEGPGNASETEWQAAAAAVKVRGASTPWEIIPLQWRSKQVSAGTPSPSSKHSLQVEQLRRVFYALDKISWISETSNNPRFHGLKANTNKNKPKGRPLRTMVDDTWFELNPKVKLNNAVPPFDLDAITILDTELEVEDLAALADTEDEV